MWSYLFGPGWGWGMLLAAGLTAVIVAAIAAMVRAIRSADRTAGDDPIQTLWHQYEQGELTGWEFARLLTPRPDWEPARSLTARPAVYSRYVFPAGGAEPAADATAAHDAAAD